MVGTGTDRGRKEKRKREREREREMCVEVQRETHALLFGAWLVPVIFSSN